MHIRIRDVAGKEEWIAKMAAFLHDATVRDPPTYDESAQTFRFALARIGYEYRRKRSWLWFFTAWGMPLVPCVLTLAPVQLLTPEEHPEGRWDFEQLVSIHSPAPLQVELTTPDGTIRLRCIGPATLTLADSGPPETRLAVTSYGGLILSPELVSEIVNTPAA
jgi:hypothetical protein